jgi:hypothetical protein
MVTTRLAFEMAGDVHGTLSRLASLGAIPAQWPSMGRHAPG